MILDTETTRTDTDLVILEYDPINRVGICSRFPGQQLGWGSWSGSWGRWYTGKALLDLFGDENACDHLYAFTHEVVDKFPDGTVLVTRRQVRDWLAAQEGR